MSYGFKLTWMIITYILWGPIFYTAVNIPYGSMASAISGDPDDRAALSIWRTIGATLANTFIGVCAPLTPRLVKKYGKREIAIAAMILSSASYLICYIVRPSNPYVYVAFYSIAYMGIGFFNSVLWAMITDVIDEAELKQGVREDGTIYSVYSFARKLGQAFSAGLSGVLLNLAGYTEETAFDPEVTSKIFDISCIGPFLGFLCTALCLIFIYKLSKKRVDENAAKLAQKHREADL